jgi:hypothetical protein
MCLEVTCNSETLLWVPPPPLPPPQYPGNRNLQHLNLKSEADRRKTFEGLSVPFMDKNRLAAAVFYYTSRGDIVRCAFCGVEVGCGGKGTLQFPTINGGVHLVGSLRDLLLEILLLTSLKHLKNLPVVMMCAGHLWS